MTDHKTWAGKLQLFFIHQLLNFSPQHFSNIELQNSLSCERAKKLSTRVGIFKNMGGNIPDGNFLCGNFLGRNFPGGV